MLNSSKCSAVKVTHQWKYILLPDRQTKVMNTIFRKRRANYNLLAKWILILTFQPSQSGETHKPKCRLLHSFSGQIEWACL